VAVGGAQNRLEADEAREYVCWVIHLDERYTAREVDDNEDDNVRIRKKTGRIFIQ
jgi:hypothetical protein